MGEESFFASLDDCRILESNEMKYNIGFKWDGLL